MQENNQEIVLDEDLSSPAHPDVATSDEIISVGAMFQQTSMPSLARQIFSVVPIHGPTGYAYNIKRKTASDVNGNKVFELVRNSVDVENSAAIHTGLTEEVVQDIRAQFGKNARVIIGQLLRGLANDDENIKTLAFLNAQAAAGGNITLSAAGNAETNLFEITQKVHELVLKINSKNTRSYKAFAVIPYAPLGGIMGLSKYAGADNKTERGLFIAEVGQTKFYLNPDATSNTAYVGIKDTNSTKSSAVFSPYTSDIINATDPDSGEIFYHLYNRYAITASPLHEATNEMLYKFDIS